MPVAQDETRGTDRKSLFAQGTMHHADGCCSIKIRNLSPTGAQVEAEQLPRKGTVVELRRGPTTVVGTVMWRQGVRAGVAFHSVVRVEEWMPRTAGAPAAEQGFQVFKQAPPAAAPAESAPPVIAADDIETVARLLDDLAETLAGDAGVLFQYSAKLQAIDVAGAMLRRLAFQARRDQAIAKASEPWR